MGIMSLMDGLLTSAEQRFPGVTDMPKAEESTNVEEGLPLPMYRTEMGRAYVGDALNLLKALKDDSIDLAVTSPPFALLRPKPYGNVNQDAYVDWLLDFCREVQRVLRDTGSLVLDLGNTYVKGRPVRSLHNYRLLLRLCDEVGFRLAQEFYWHNLSKLPSSMVWVAQQKIRVKDSVDMVPWLSKSDNPKAFVRHVLRPYSLKTEKVFLHPERFKPSKSPSGYERGPRLVVPGAGSIPSNMLQFGNNDSMSPYLRLCKLARAKIHPARFPEKLPAFFIKFLTSPGDLVLDFFAGSNTTGAVAEALGRRWIAFEKDIGYLASSVFRFTQHSMGKAEAIDIYQRLCREPSKGLLVPISRLAL